MVGLYTRIKEYVTVSKNKPIHKVELNYDFKTMTGMDIQNIKSFVFVFHETGIQSSRSLYTIFDVLSKVGGLMKTFHFIFVAIAFILNCNSL